MNPAPEKVKLIAGGDIMLGEHPIMVGCGMLTQMLRDRMFSPFSAVADIFQNADLAFANLECVLSDPPSDAKTEERECRGPTHGIECLKAAGFTALSVANNHIQQYGTEVFTDTVEALIKAGIEPVGRAVDAEGRCLPVDVEHVGLQVRLLGYSLRPRQHFNNQPRYAEGTLDGIISDVHEGRQLGRIVIVSLHWGDEFMRHPSAEQVVFGRAIIDAGATLILGHHPHVLQGFEKYRQGVIVYSLGNLVFDMPWLPELRQTALFSCRLMPEGVDQPEWVPLHLNDQHCPHPASEQDASEIVDFLKEASISLQAGNGHGVGQDMSDYQVELARQSARQRKASHRHFVANIRRYEFSVLRSVIGKFVKRRIGLLKD